MRKLSVILLITLLLSSLKVLNLHSQERRVMVTKKERRIALVIGNSAYKSSPLINPVNDANDIAEVLNKLGFDVTLKTDANQRAMISTIREFGEKLKKGGTGLFYFAGHGMQVKGVNYLIPVDSEIQKEDEIEFEAIDANRILRKMESAGNKMNIVILDACRDNPFARSFRSTFRGLARMDAPTGSLIVYSTAPGETAADGRERNGIFTKYLLKNIKVPGLKIEDVLKRVRKEVMEATNNSQVPWESSSLTGDFYFIINMNLNNQQQTLVHEPKLPVSPKVDLSDIEAEAKKNLEAKQKEKKAWSDWQKEFQEQFNKARQIEEDENVSAGSKKESWERILNAYIQDNPYSSEDEELRTYANDRVKYWQNEIKRQSTLSQQVTKPSIQLSTYTGNRLRSSYMALSIYEVKSMLKRKGFFDKLWNKSGSFSNNYQSRMINGDKVVIDHATGLMWHQSGSNDKLTYEKAEQWIRDINNRGYAGYNDWRLPTLEEGASLLENSKQNGYSYIDPIFSIRQEFIWTGDKYGSGAAWVVVFSNGRVGYDSHLYFENYVRPIRPRQSTVNPQVTKPSYQPSTLTVTQLRSSYRTLSSDDVGTMIKLKGFFNKYWNKSGSFNNNYQARTINEDKVVIDRATGLMWHQSGSSEWMKYKKVKKWINKLNSSGYTGYYDWRLPMIEEAVSLLESSEKNDDLHIDSVFSNKQKWIWTGDKFDFGGAWAVFFFPGGVGYDYPPGSSKNYVRPVRTGQ